MTDAFGAASRLLASQPALRVVNFHHTPPARAREIDAMLAKLASHFAPVDEAALNAYAQSGRWPGKPGVIPAFYNGYRSNFDVAAPLLDKHGLTGWFFVVTGFVGEPDAMQRAYAAEHGMGVPADGEARIALSWKEVRALGGRHVVASHSRSHAKPAGLDETSLADEASGAQEDFQREFGRPVGAIAWASGTAYGENSAADRAVERAGYRLVVSNFRVQFVGTGS
jgi:peptidoglycan/xylan/chitin deacetylase (PgdA/CDA1 family)